MSELMIRNLALACVPKLAAKVEAAVLATVRDELPRAIESSLREMYAGERVQFYMSKRPAGQRRERDAIIRSRFNGHNFTELSVEFCISTRTVRRIVGVK